MLIKITGLVIIVLSFVFYLQKREPERTGSVVVQKKKKRK